MAGISQVSFTSPYAAEEMAIERRRKLAEMLATNAAAPMPTDMVGGWAVKRSPLEGLARLAQGASSAYLGNQAEERQKALGEKASSERSQALSRALGMMTGTPGGAEDTGGGDIVQQPAQAPNLMGAMQALSQSNAPDLQAAGTKGLISQMLPQKPVVVGRTLIDPKNPGKPLAIDSTWQSEQEMSRVARSDESQLKREEAAAAQKRQQEFQSNENRQRALDRAALVQAQSSGKVPPGYRQTPDGNLQAIPGGPADTKQQGVLNQDTAMLQGSTNSMDRLAAAANEALNHPGLAGTMGLRGVIPNIPGTAAADAAAKLSTLKSQVAFGVLQDMRNNSKTGGALGQVSDKEGALLQANLAALEKSQSVEQMKESLQKIIKYTDDAKGRLQNAYNMKHKDASTEIPQRRSSDSAIVLRFDTQGNSVK